MFGVYARRRLTAIGVLLMILGLGWHVGEAHTATSTPMPTRTIVVAPGDTVWAIAERYGSGDPREDVDALSKLNHLHGGQVGAGQSLKVPLFL